MSSGAKIIVIPVKTGGFDVQLKDAIGQQMQNVPLGCYLVIDVMGEATTEIKLLTKRGTTKGGK